jgi:hypothetical protein
MRKKASRKTRKANKIHSNILTPNREDRYVKKERLPQERITLLSRKQNKRFNADRQKHIDRLSEANRWGLPSTHHQAKDKLTRIAEKNQAKDKLTRIAEKNARKIGNLIAQREKDGMDTTELKMRHRYWLIKIPGWESRTSFSN